MLIIRNCNNDRETINIQLASDHNGDVNTRCDGVWRGATRAGHALALSRYLVRTGIYPPIRSGQVPVGTFVSSFEGHPKNNPPGGDNRAGRGGMGVDETPCAGRKKSKLVDQ
jgi:hypothetical protein